MTIDVDKFQKDLKIKFKNKSLLIQALTHKSANQKSNNEMPYRFALIAKEFETCNLQLLDKL